MKIQAACTTDSLIDFHRISFEMLGFDMLNVNTDMDCFRLKVSRNNNTANVKFSTWIEPLLFGSLEIFSRFLSCSYDSQRSNSYFINLHPKPLFSNSFVIEVDYFETSNDVIYLEAYCYDEVERLVGKGGYMMLKE